uniref:Uncharacterized protein n=1 Tax=Arundo donax TaxID=35708 RepID=A0A0A9F3V2_ARUDO
MYRTAYILFKQLKSVYIFGVETRVGLSGSSGSSIAHVLNNHKKSICFVSGVLPSLVCCILVCIAVGVWTIRRHLLLGDIQCLLFL